MPDRQPRNGAVADLGRFEDDVEPAEFAHVESRRGGPPADSTNPISGSLGRCAVAVGAEHRRALACHRLGPGGVSSPPKSSPGPSGDAPTKPPRSDLIRSGICNCSARDEGNFVEHSLRSTGTEAVFFRRGMLPVKSAHNAGLAILPLGTLAARNRSTLSNAYSQMHLNMPPRDGGGRLLRRARPPSHRRARFGANHGGRDR